MVGTVVPFLHTRRGIMVFQHDRVNYQLRPDTPKTQEALLKLGYEPSIFKFK